MLLKVTDADQRQKIHQLLAEEEAETLPENRATPRMTKSKIDLQQDQIKPARNAVRWMKFVFVGATAISVGQYPVLAQPLGGDPASGRQIVTTQCGSCHRVLPMLSLDGDKLSPVDKDGPPSFQSVADLPSTTGLSLKVFLRSNHKNMPGLILSEAETDDIIAYILGLKKQ